MWKCQLLRPRLALLPSWKQRLRPNILDCQFEVCRGVTLACLNGNLKVEITEMISIISYLTPNSLEIIVAAPC